MWQVIYRGKRKTLGLMQDTRSTNEPRKQENGLVEKGERNEMIGSEYILKKLTIGAIVSRGSVYMYGNYLVISPIGSALKQLQQPINSNLDR